MAKVVREFEFRCRFGYGAMMRWEDFDNYTVNCDAGVKDCPAIAYCDEKDISHKCKSNDETHRVDVVDFSGDATCPIMAKALREAVISLCRTCQYKQR